jgi:hypothetical protein
MSDDKSKHRAVGIAIIVGAGLTLSVSANALARLADAPKENKLTAFRVAFAQGMIVLSKAGDPGACSRPGEETLQDYSDTFNDQRFKDGSPGLN